MAKALDVVPRHVDRQGVTDADHERLSRLTVELTKRSKAQHGLVAVEWGGGGRGGGERGGDEQRNRGRWIGAAGVADGSGGAMEPGTPYFIASISKMFVATVVLKLWERGQLELDGPIRQHLPRELVDGIHRMDGVDYTERITLRHLLTHTSGLADWFEDRPRSGSSVVERALKEGDVSLGAEDIAAYVREQLQPHFPPWEEGTRPRPPRYCNTNFDLLMAIVDRAVGEPFEDVLAREVLRPLGMANTSFAGRGEATPVGNGDGSVGNGATPLGDRGTPMGNGTSPLGNGATPMGNGTTPGAAVWLGERALDVPRLLRSTRTLNSTAADLLTFMRALVGGELFQERSTWELMSGQWRRFGFPRDVAAMRAPQWPIAYGMGVMHFEFPPPMSLLMGMPPVVGHTGSTGSWLFYCAELDVYVCGTVSQATGGPVPFRFVPKLLRELRRMGLG